MHNLIKITALALLGVATAQTRPNGTSVCDYYTTALLKENNATNQLTLLTLVVNTAVIGNYTQPNVGIMVPGILAPGMYNGTSVNLLPYFDGSLESSNRGGRSGVSVNFLDDGGAAPLMMNKPANGTSSAQYMLLTHLYEFFGALLGCSQYGMTGYPAYSGHTNMYEVHKFMALEAAEVGYFIQQVGLSAMSFGVTKEDATTVGMALTKLFDYRCSAAVAVLPDAPVEPQSICIADDCMLATPPMCSIYDAVVEPKNHTTGMTGMNGTNSTGSGSSGSSGSGSSGSGSGNSTGGGIEQSNNAVAYGAGQALLFGISAFAAVQLLL